MSNSIGRDNLISLLRDPRMSEAVSVVPAGGREADRVQLTARVRRVDRTRVEKGDDVLVYHTAEIKFLRDGTGTLFGGYATAALGDVWKLGMGKGEDLVDGWVAGEIQSGDGWRVVTVSLEDVVKRGGKMK